MRPVIVHGRQSWTLALRQEEGQGECLDRRQRGKVTREWSSELSDH